jgi:hypothetical protein
MSTSAQYLPANTSSYSAFDTGDAYVPMDIEPGERIGVPLARKRRKIVRRGILSLCMLGAGYGLYTDPSIPSRWWPVVTEAVAPLIERAMLAASGPSKLIAGTEAPPINAESATKAAAIDQRAASPEPSVSRTVATSPIARPQVTAEPPLTTAALPPATNAVEEASAAPLPPPVVNRADPYQVKAAAVGLHPELSRVLLTRLTPADYQNAGIAIKTAMAETPDSGVYVWPRQRKPELALFQVRFVQGAAPDCRRYVVTVTKDGWLTTALPMERCSVQAVKPPRA